eukprot:1868611-Rhodomonas_salina.1
MDGFDGLEEGSVPAGACLAFAERERDNGRETVARQRWARLPRTASKAHLELRHKMKHAAHLGLH